MGELTPLGQRYGIDLVNVDNQRFYWRTAKCEEKGEVMYFSKKPTLFVFRDEIGYVIH